MSLFGRKTTIVTHDGRFHTDDIFACAVVSLVLKKEGSMARIVRTRDEKLIADSKFVVDVGGIHDPATNRFDHHQVGGAGTRSNGIPFAAFGLVWKNFGAKLSGGEAVAQMIDEKLVMPVDADDNGVALVTPNGTTIPYTIQSFLGAFRPTWKEDPKMYNESFLTLVPIAEKIITREIKIATDTLLAKDMVIKAYGEARDKRMITLDAPYPFNETLVEYPEVLYVVIPKFGSSSWKVETVFKSAYGFVNRKDLPASWAGKRDEELSKISGVDGAVFCHNGRFMAVAKTKEGAIALAQKAIEA